MTNKQTGWVIIILIPGDERPTLICHDEFAYMRRECIENFIKGSSHPWKYWYRKFNYRCVKATRTIEIEG